MGGKKEKHEQKMTLTKGDKMRINLKNKTQLVMLILIVLTLVFIFYQSSLSPEDSSKNSTSVGEILNSVVEKFPEGEKSPSSSSDSANSSNKGESSSSSSKDDDTDKDESRLFVGKINLAILRKVAHFLEHGILGMWFFFLFKSMEGEKHILKSVCPLGAKTLLLTVNIGVLAALADETIQIFSSRGSAVKDIWIDVAGYCTFTAVFYISFLITRLVRKNT